MNKNKTQRTNTWGSLLSLFAVTALLNGCEKPSGTSDTERLKSLEAEIVALKSNKNGQVPPQSNAVDEATQRMHAKLAGVYVQNFGPDEKRTIELKADGKWIWKGNDDRIEDGGMFSIHDTRTDELVLTSSDKDNREPRRYQIVGKDLKSLVRGTQSYPHFINQTKDAEYFINKGTVKINNLDDYSDPALDAAVIDFTKAIELDPKGPAYYYRAEALAKKGDHDGAISDYTKAIEYKGERYAIPSISYHGRANSRASKHDYEGAFADFNKALESYTGPLYTEREGLFCDRAAVRGNKYDHDGAIADYVEALKINPKSIRAFSGSATAKVAKGDIDGAVADYTKVIELAPKSWMAKEANEKLIMFGKRKK